MQHEFWHERWSSGRIGFHESDVNPLLAQNFARLNLQPRDSVFVPLCGKTLDIAWLLAQGMQVKGVELSQLAVEQLFEEMQLSPVVTPHPGSTELARFSAENIDIWCGDFFKLGAATLGKVDAVYDRAALVALPPQMRSDYARHLAAVTEHAAQLLITFEYDQQLMQGPPFSVSSNEVHDHYSMAFDLDEAVRRDMPGGLKGKFPAIESVWMMRQKTVAD